MGVAGYFGKVSVVCRHRDDFLRTGRGVALDEDEFANPEVAFGIKFYDEVQVVFDFRCVRSEELADWEYPAEVTAVR